MSATRRAVFLDRDGVLNRCVVRDGRPYPPAGLEELEILPGVDDALRRLASAGFLLVGVTNQPDVARGTLPREVVEAIHARLRELLPLDDLRVCYEADNAYPRRKPNPGMLLEAAAEWGIDPAASFMVGDRWSDVEAGHRAGCRTVFVDHGYAERRPDPPADFTTHNLAGGADWILGLAPAVKALCDLRVKLFADGADLAGMRRLYADPRIKGFTTNPTLMHKDGVTDYETFARQVLEAIPDRPVSFEVFADDFAEMRRQALKIAGWGANVYVKIPVTNTLRQSAAPLVRDLAQAGLKLNVTAVFTLAQVEEMTRALEGGPPAVVSVFAGRVADAGVDPVPHMTAAGRIVHAVPGVELLWASPREVLNVLQADAADCDIITATADILKKLDLLGKDLREFSLETVKMFHEDGRRAGYRL